MITDSFTTLQHKSRPHKVFKLDWSSYDTEKFGSTFLPYSDQYLTDSVIIFDGANLFNHLSTRDDLIYDLWIEEEPIEITIYTFAEGVEAFKKQDRIRCRPNEIVLKMTVKESDEVDIKTELGEGVSRFLNRLASKDKKLYLNSRLKQNLTHAKSDIESVFGKTLVQKTFLESIFSLVGIDNKIVKQEAELMILENSSKSLANRRRQKKVLDEKGGHVINEKGEVIWRSDENPDNGYTWRYSGNLTIKNLTYEELIELKDIELITKGEIDKEGRTTMVFVGKDFDYQNLIKSQVELLEIKAPVKIRPVNVGNFAFVLKGYRKAEKQRYPRENGWQSGADMGSIVLTDKNKVEFVWNSKGSNTIGMANIYDIRSILVHEYKHYTLQMELFSAMEKRMIAYAEENEISYQNEKELEDKIKEKLNQYEWDNEIARFWFFQIDNNFFLPTAKYSDPFMEVIAYAEQVNHSDYLKTSMQLRIAHTNIIFPSNPRNEKTTNYLWKQLERKDGLYESNSSLTRTDWGLKFWNHKNKKEYKDFIYTKFKAVRNLMGLK